VARLTSYIDVGAVRSGMMSVIGEALDEPGLRRLIRVSRWQRRSNRTVRGGGRGGKGPRIYPRVTGSLHRGHLLYVISDNDLVPSLPTQIFAFAIDEATLAAPFAYEPQFLPGPLYPPGQVKKQIGK
jgi:hypothetical protein